MTTNSTAAPLQIRPASTGDIIAILTLIAEDESGHHADRPDGALDAYAKAFDDIAADPRNELYVAERDGAVLGTFQLTYIPHLFDGGCERVQIEAMFVAAAARGQGIGSAMLAFAFERARRRGCAMAELYSNKSRADAHRFYLAAGFKATHEGFKAVL